FVTLKKRGKRPYVIISYLAAFSVIMVYYVLGNALFGNYLFGIDNFFIKLSSFNFLSDELGRLEWTGIISWVVICIINISVLLWAAIEAGGRLIKKRNAAAVSVIIAAAAAVTVMNPFDYRKFADLSWFGYTLAVLGFAVPLILCVFSEITKRRGGGAEQSDNKPNEAAENNEVRNENEDEDGFSVRKPSLAGTPDTERAAYGFPSEKMSVADTATKKDGNGSQTRKRPPADAPTDKKDSRNSADVKGKSSVKNPLFEDSEDGKDGFALEKPSPADAAKIKSGSVVKKPSPENSAGIKSGSAIKRPPATNSGKGKGGSVVKKPSLTDSAGEESYAPAKVEKYAKRGRPKPEQNG
ncbi:MAG: hypothetical protein LBC13_03180, partial [Clostridiales bacterium]|nr:hypothetical protein [Clostridiales bacterium]